MRRGPRLIATATAMGLAALVYVNALHNPFVYDDYSTVLQNPSLQDPSNFLFVLVHSPFRPVINLSYAVDAVLWGRTPFGFHLTNVVLHAMLVGLLFAFILRALQDARVRGRDAGDSRVDLPAAFAGAVLFAVHPMMSEAVGYISGRSEVLCGVFFLGALLSGRAAMLPSAPGTSRLRRPLLMLATLLLGVLAFLSKEVAIALPVVLVAYDWLILPGTPEARLRRFRWVYAPLFAVATLLASYRWTALMAIEAVPSAAPLLTLLTQAIVIWRYLGLLLLPVGQSIMHGVHRVTSPADPLAWTAIAGLAAVVAVAFKLRRTQPLLSFGIIWFFAALAPSSSIVALREGMAEHRVYLASAGLFMSLAWLSARMLTSSNPGRSRVPPGFFLVVLGAVIVLSVLTLARNAVWASPVRLWAQAVERSPGMWEPHYALGDALREYGQCDRAVQEYRTVIALRPQHRDAHTNLGICLGQLGRFAEAEAALTRVLEIDPSYARGYTNLGTLATLTGEPGRARALYLKAIGMNPKAVLARLQLARLHEATDRDYAAALRLCTEAQAIDPTFAGVGECIERNRQLLERSEDDR